MMVNILILLVICSSYVVVYSDLITMEIFKDEKRCVGQNLDEEDEATFTLSIAEDQDHTKHPNEGVVSLDTVRASVIDPDGTVLRGGIIKQDKIIDFYMKIEKRGVYNMCFEVERATENDAVHVSFVVAYKNRGAGSGRFKSRKIPKDNNNKNNIKATEENELELELKDEYEFSALEEMLQDAQESLLQISNEIDFARRQENKLLVASASMESRLQWFGWLSMVILMFTSLWQIVYLRHFFASKKLL